MSLFFPGCFANVDILKWIISQLGMGNLLFPDPATSVVAPLSKFSSFDSMHHEPASTEHSHANQNMGIGEHDAEKLRSLEPNIWIFTVKVGGSPHIRVMCTLCDPPWHVAFVQDIELAEHLAREHKQWHDNPEK